METCIALVVITALGGRNVWVGMAGHGGRRQRKPQEGLLGRLLLVGVGYISTSCRHLHVFLSLSAAKK